MPRRARYDYYDSPRHSGVRPGQLRQLVHSHCMLRCSLRSLERWYLELYVIREGWVPGDSYGSDAYWTPLNCNWSHEEMCEEMREVGEIHERRSAALASVGGALTVGVRPRRE